MGLLTANLACTTCEQQFSTLDVGGAQVPVINGDATFSRQLAQLGEQLFADPQQLRAWLEGDDPLQRAMAGGLVTYAQAHYGQFAEPPLPSADLGWLRGWLPRNLPDGDIALLGCGTGGELLAIEADLPDDRSVWLADANLAALAWGKMLAIQGLIPLPYRESATRLGWSTAQIPQSCQHVLSRAHWLCCDALRPPWPAASLAAVITVGLIDSVADPIALIQQVEALLAPGGVWLLATPWNWQEAVTPQNRQLERFVDGSDLDDGVAKLLTGCMIPGLGAELRIDRRELGVTWRLPVHGRMTVEYLLDVLLLRKID